MCIGGGDALSSLHRYSGHDNRETDERATFKKKRSRPVRICIFPSFSFKKKSIKPWGGISVEEEHFSNCAAK